MSVNMYKLKPPVVFPTYGKSNATLSLSLPRSSDLTNRTFGRTEWLAGIMLASIAKSD